MSYVVAGYVAVLGGLGVYAARLVLRSREVAGRITERAATAPEERS